MKAPTVVWCKKLKNGQHGSLQASLLSAWQATAALRTSVAAQKVQLHRETHGQALDELLASQVGATYDGIEARRLFSFLVGFSHGISDPWRSV